MKTMLKLTVAMMLSIGCVSGAAQAAPGDLEQDSSALTILEPAERACYVKAGLCLKAGEPSTQLSGPLLSATLGPQGLSWDPPSFARRLPGPLGRTTADEVPWTVEVNASLRRPAWAGNAVFVLTDVEEPTQTVASHVVTAVYQAKVEAGDRINARLRLRADDGFRAGHTYRLRIVQLIENGELELAAGELRLK